MAMDRGRHVGGPGGGILIIFLYRPVHGKLRGFSAILKRMKRSTVFQSQPIRITSLSLQMKDVALSIAGNSAYTCNLVARL